MDMTREQVADALLARLERDGMHGSADTLAALIRAAIAHLRQPAPTAPHVADDPDDDKAFCKWREDHDIPMSDKWVAWSAWCAAIATAQAAAGVPVGAIHKDTLAMLPNLRTFDGGAKLWPTSKAEYDTDYVLVFAAPSAPAQSDSADARDAARLDWLDRQAEAYGFQETHEGNKWEIGGAYRTVRDAIDAAIAASAAKGEQPCE